MTNLSVLSERPVGNRGKRLAVTGEPARRPNLAASIKDALQAEIESGRLMPGSFIDERTLAAKYSVSRTPVREALQQLASMKLVQILPRRGVVVSKMSIPELRDTLELLGELEALCAKLAARRVSEELRIAIEAAFQRVVDASASGRPRDYSEANLAFHEAIQEGGRNKLLIQEVRPMRALILRYNVNNRLFQTPARIEKSVRDHRMIADAILEGDEQRAYELMLQHQPAGASGFSEFISHLPPEFFDGMMGNGPTY